MATTATPSDAQVYLSIDDALKSPPATKVNLFAAVYEIGAAAHSRGSDFFVTLKIIDDSCPVPGISATFFAANTANLPSVKESGDIICLHNIEIKIYKGDYFCLYHKNTSSFALFKGYTVMDSNPYQVSTYYHASKFDDTLLSRLRRWLVDHSPNAVLRENDLQIKSIETDIVLDLVCKVLHVHETLSGERVLFVWDGTDAPSMALQTNLYNEEQTPSPLHLVEVHMPRDVLCTFPCFGTILRITSTTIFKELVHLKRGPAWVRLCNITCELQFGMWKGVFHHSSKVRLLSDVDASVKDRQRLYDNRRQSKKNRQPQSCFPWPAPITVIDHEHVPYATLMCSLINKEIAHKFKCIVRVVAACPWRAEHLRSASEGHYRVRFTLEDPTARIHAYIYKEDGVKFFGGWPTPDTMTRYMKTLLGITSSAIGESNINIRYPPWIWCCLHSYYLDESDPWKSRRYRIFDTKLSM